MVNLPLPWWIQGNYPVIAIYASHYMGFHVNPIKRIFRELGCCTWHNYWCVRHIFYVLHMILTISKLSFAGSFSILNLIYYTIFHDGSERFFWNYIAILMPVFTVEVCISICVSYTTTLVIFTVVVNIEKNCLPVEFKPSMKYLPCTGGPTLL